MRPKPTIRELLDCKRRRKLTLTTAFDTDTAAACQEAGLDVVLTWSRTMNSMEELMLRLREVCAGAPSCAIGAALPINPAYQSETEAVRCAYEAVCAGGNLIYASGMEMSKFRAICRERIPAVGHVGLVPFQATWMGGLRAVGKTPGEALEVYRRTLAYQEAGCVAVEMECVPRRVAAYIASRVDILVFSMGSGPDCDGQFLFSCDILGSGAGRIPRHAKKYRDIFALSAEALSEYRQDVASGAFPENGHSIQITDDAFDSFFNEAEKIK